MIRCFQLHQLLLKIRKVTNDANILLFKRSNSKNKNLNNLIKNELNLKDGEYIFVSNYF